MVFKKLFGSGGNKEKLEQELDVDDLIALERYEEAADRLKERTKSHPNDLHSHLKLASVYQAQGQNLKAVDEFVYVADELADDGFYDKGLALLAKAIRMAPGDSSITERVDRLENLKRLSTAVPLPSKASCARTCRARTAARCRARASSRRRCCGRTCRRPPW